MTIAISVASKLTDNAVELNDFYSELPKLITEEHLAIERNDLIEIERIAQLKSLIGEKVELSLIQHVSSVELLLKSYQENIDENKTCDRSLLSCLDLMDGISNSYDFDLNTLEHKVFVESAKNLETSLLRLKESFEKTQPLVEKNRVVIQKMLESQRENFNFWTKIAKDESSSYDATGSQNRSAQGQNSLLNVRA
jgi:hypothetical protein